MERPSIRSTLALFAGLAACQTLPGEPPCATSCLSSAVSAVSCVAADLGCQCTSRPAIAFLAGPCLLAACNPDQLQDLSSAESAACSSFSAGKLSTLENKDVGTTTTTSRPSATGQMASPVLGLGPSPPPPVQTVTATETSPGAGASATQAPADAAQPATVKTDGQAAIGLSGVVAGAGAVSIFMWTWQRRKRRQENELAKRKEAIPVDDLASWVRANAAAEEQREKAFKEDDEDEKAPKEDDKDEKDEKREKRDLKKLRYTGVNLTGKDGPVELEVPGAVFELPGAVMRHEFEG